MTLTRRIALKQAAAFGVAALAAPSLSRARAADRWIIRGSLPLTGPFAEIGLDGLKSTQDWVEMKNAAGGIAGRRIDISFEDSGYNPKTALSNFKRTMAAEVRPHFYFGDSTGFMTLVRPELARTPVLSGGASFANELADPKANPCQFISGPSYDAMAEIAMRYIAGNGGRRVAVVYSDTAFGRDPLAHARAAAADLGLEIVIELATKLQGVDAAGYAAKLDRAGVDHVFIHGYVAGVWPEILAEARALGVDAQFVGTFWSMDLKTIRAKQDRYGGAMDGYAGVMPYRYLYEAADHPAYREIVAFREAKYGRAVSDHITAWSLQELATFAILEKIFLDVVAADLEPTPQNLAQAIGRIRNWDSGGYFGLPATMATHSINQARICQYDAATRLFVQVTPTIRV
ncbi:ABC transporter substrate-binding protein [Pikeienuella sp. HZG-20]|uniref:ABC transporter substrate-binding protein n=1 Tax=Paludibacillus litoralis TaxID=3133267 RepID=UPI0030EBAA0B